MRLGTMCIVMELNYMYINKVISVWGDGQIVDTVSVSIQTILFGFFRLFCLFMTIQRATCLCLVTKLLWEWSILHRIYFIKYIYRISCTIYNKFKPLLYTVCTYPNSLINIQGYGMLYFTCIRNRRSKSNFQHHELVDQTPSTNTFFHIMYSIRMTQIRR